MQEKEQGILQGIPHLSFLSLQVPQRYIKRSGSVLSQGTPEKPALLPWLSLDFP